MHNTAGREHQLRRQLSDLHALFVLGMVMTESRDVAEILRLTVSAAPSLGRCAAAAYFNGAAGPVHPPGAFGPDLEAALGALGDAESELTPTGWAWARAYPLQGLGRHRGHLAVAADAAPSPDEEFLWRVLAHQAGSSLANADLHREETSQAAALAAANDRLAATVAALERTLGIHEALARVSAAGTGEAGIADAVYELTGRGVAVEDAFGNLRAWAGPNRPDPYPKPDLRRRARLLDKVKTGGRPVRDGGRLVAAAQPRDEVLGILALADPHQDTSPPDLVALQHGAVVLAMELAHRRSLAEAELRLRHGLVHDLVTGTDAASAYRRAEALGYDLHRGHQVVAIAAPGPEEVFAAAVQKAAGPLGLNALTGRRAGATILLVPAPARARELLAALGDHGPVAIGVGGQCVVPEEFPTSCEQAFIALEVRRGSATPHGVSGYTELGVFRLLAAAGKGPELEAFVRQWLGALLDYDTQHSADLVRTLAEYLECGGNYDLTAKAVAVHRSTLRYRLQRIREISGYDLADVDSRFNLHAATRAWRLLRGPTLSA
ncbi:MAG: PucR family transcriptional regulator [Sporichthyaceae bacterium]